MTTPLTAQIVMVQPSVGALICVLRTMREEIAILTLIATRTAVPIVTVISGLDHDMGIISSQMSWRFIMKCLLEPRHQQKKTNKAKNNNGNKNKPAKNKQTTAMNK